MFEVESLNRFCDVVGHGVVVVFGAAGCIVRTVVWYAAAAGRARAGGGGV